MSSILNDLDRSEDASLWKTVLNDLRSGSSGDKDTNVKDVCKENEYNCFMNRCEHGKEVLFLNIRVICIRLLIC